MKKKILGIASILLCAALVASVSYIAINSPVAQAQEQSTTLSIKENIDFYHCKVVEPRVNMCINWSASSNKDVTFYLGDVLNLYAYTNPSQSNLTLTFYKNNEVLGQAVTNANGDAFLLYRVMETGEFNFYALP